MRVGIALLEQAGLEPPVEPFDPAIALRSGRWDEYGLDAETQTQPNDARQVPGCWSPADELAADVELKLLGSSQSFPALAQEVQDGLHLARTAQF